MGRLTIFCIAKIVPKQKNLWVFGAWKGEKYSDNSKYLFEYVCKRYPKIEPLWITKNELAHELVGRGGGKVAYFGSLRATWACMKAGVAVTCVDSAGDLPGYAIGSRTKRVQLWHGLGPKAYHMEKMSERAQTAVEQMDIVSKIINKLVLIYAYLLTGKWFNGIKWLPYYLMPQQDLVVTTSELGRQKMQQVFGQLAKKIEILGYPRHDHLLESKTKPSREHKRIKVLYAPTHRRESQTSVIAQVEKLKQAMAQHPEIDLVVKLHDLVDEREGADLRVLSEGEIEQEIYTVLPTIDVLITDYSSIYTDYLLLNRPIIFTPFDLNDYRENDQGFFLDYDSVTPGPKAKDWQEVMEHIFTYKVWEGKYASDQERVLNLFHEVRDGHSSERIVERIKQL